MTHNKKKQNSALDWITTGKANAKLQILSRLSCWEGIYRNRYDDAFFDSHLSESCRCSR